MKDVICLKINGTIQDVNIIRYFINGDQRYLIFTLNEKDESGYARLYVCKMAYGDAIKATTITDEDEWNRVKELIKVTIRENKDNKALSIVDLNYADIKNVEVVDSKVFKLLDSMVEILASNKKIFEDANDIVVDNKIEKEPDPSDLKYKELYFKEVENRKLVEKDLKKAIDTINSFKEKINEISQMLN